MRISRDNKGFLNIVLGKVDIYHQKNQLIVIYHQKNMTWMYNIETLHVIAI